MRTVGDAMLLSLAAVSSVVTVARLRPHAAQGAPVPAGAIGLVDSLQREAGVGSGALLVVFTDYECPACQRFEEVLGALRKAHPDLIVSVKHFPLEEVHFQSLPAALHAECARRQGLFWPMHERLMATEFAREDGWRQAIRAAVQIPDSSAFEACLSRTDTKERIRRDMALATRLGLHGTPTMLVAHRLYAGALRQGQLEAILYP